MRDSKMIVDVESQWAQALVMVVSRESQNNMDLELANDIVCQVRLLHNEMDPRDFPGRIVSLA
jgi:hypothetical protein